ncbi:MAG: glucosyltransferase domain-containing protein [Clostridia bacterium]|nr:glucosyltransferase domain-containing protein [Clostridia bacterium]
MIRTEKKENNIFSGISVSAKTAFIACFAAGLLVHLFAFTNIIPNSDGLSRVYDTQQMTVSGRWFLHYASYLNGFIQAPSLIGLISVFFFSISSALTCEILNIKSRLFSALCGITMVVFPCVSYTYMYMFTASAYSVGVFLAVISVYLCRRYKFGFIAGIIPLALATGTYQAYFSVASSLCVCVLMLDIFSSEKTSGILKKAGKYLLFLFGGISLYYIILKIFLSVKQLKLLSYLGMSSLSLSPKAIFSGIVSVYKQFVLSFFVPNREPGVNAAWVFINILVLSAFIGALTVLIRKNKSKISVSKILILLFLIALFPVCSNVMGILSYATPIMKYAYVLAYVLVMAMCSMSFNGIGFTLLSPVSLVTLIFSAVIMLSAQTDNTIYTASATAMRATQTFASNLVSRVESLDGYKSDMEVVIIGVFPNDTYYNENIGFDYIEHYSADPSSAILRNKHIYYYLNDWLNVPWSMPEEQTLITVSESDEFKKMPLYPSSGSVKLIDGRVVVRLSEEYTPLEQYEIDYENRH